MRNETLSTPLQFLILMRFHNPIGIFLLLWPTLWALWIAAKGTPNLLILAVFLIGVVIMRAAGCVINDIADRHIDHRVERTKTRPLTSGKLKLSAAMLLFIALYVVAFALVCLLNTLTIQLAIAGAGIAVLYPFTKRFTHWPQLILGLAFSWGIPMAFAAVTEHIPGIAWLLFTASVFWSITYDTEYAMADREDDIKIGMKSTAILFGKYDHLVIGLFQILILSLFIFIGIILSMQWSYYLCVVAGAGIFLYHQRLITQRNPDAYFKAFLKNNWFGLIIFLGIVTNYGI